MRRREFIAFISASAAWPLAARAQQLMTPHRIAVVHPSRPIAVMSDSGLWIFRAFFEELRRLGYVEGQNLVVMRYSGEGRTEHYAELARDVVRSKPELIFAVSARMAQHLKDATSTIPIVAYTADPIANGLAPSLARPAGNITGVVPDAGEQVWDKLLEFLREATPSASTVAYLSPRAVWNNSMGATIRKAALRIGIELLGALLDDPIQEGEYRRVFSTMAQKHADALIVNDAPENYTYQSVILEMVEKARLPTVYPNRYFVELGGLMSYGTDSAFLFGHAANQIDQILRGVRPRDIPFYQAIKFELVINLKTAKALGLELSPMLLARADEVIE
jgi:putative ABC transport system substrate-binding protein